MGAVDERTWLWHYKDKAKSFVCFSRGSRSQLRLRPLALGHNCHDALAYFAGNFLK